MTRRRSPGAPLPLMMWAEEMRRREAARRRQVRRWSAGLIPLVAAVSASIVLPLTPRIIWNASASAPIGLYMVTPRATLRRGSMVIVRVPAAVRSLAASRRYIPINVPLVKHVGAIAGDTVCAAGVIITIDGRPSAIRRASDGAGRPMPWWWGCRQLRIGEVFLLSPDAPASFDGRYFGVSPSNDIIGTARLLWAKPTQGSNDE